MRALWLDFLAWLSCLAFSRDVDGRHAIPPRKKERPSGPRVSRVRVPHHGRSILVRPIIRPSASLDGLSYVHSWTNVLADLQKCHKNNTFNFMDID